MMWYRTAPFNRINNLGYLVISPKFNADGRAFRNTDAGLG